MGDSNPKTNVLETYGFRELLNTTLLFAEQGQNTKEDVDYKKHFHALATAVQGRKLDYDQKMNVTLHIQYPPPEQVQFPKIQENTLSYRPVIPAKFREAERQDISLLLVGMCIFCYAFVFYMIGWCAERRKPSTNNNGHNHSNSNPHPPNSTSQRDRHCPQYQQDDCYPELRNEISSFVSFYSALGINFSDCSRTADRSYTSARNQYFDRPPRYNDLTDVVIDIDIPEAETPPPSYTQVLANDRREIYQLRQM